jgi:SAM-dependent methyltransferase
MREDGGVDVTLLDQLLSRDGERLLAEIEATYDGDNALAVSERMRDHHDAAVVAAALTQITLRRKAAAKLGDRAARLFFTPDGLEQATHGLVADRRAARLREAGVRSLLELGCGIGADLMAFAAAGLEVVALDRDPVAAALARANLRVLGLTGTVEVGEARKRDRSGFDAVFADPGRRTGRGRVFDPEAFSPPWSFVEDLLTGTAVVKAAPGIPHEAIPAGVEAEWVSLDGQLREATLWSGGLARHSRSATVMTTSGAPHTLTGQETPPVEVRPVGRYVYEPDDAVIRAHLVTAVADATAGWLLDPHLAYVSSDRLVDLPWARAFRVHEVLPYREKQLRAALRTRDIGPLTIKKRGVSIAPEVLRQRLGLRGRRPATLMLSRTPGSAVALLVEPLPGGTCERRS